MSDWERVFRDACDEIGCAYDNEALLKAIADLKTSRSAVAQQPGDPLAGLVERLDRLCLTSTADGRFFTLATESAQNIVEIVREWIRSGAGYAVSSTDRVNLPGHDETMANLDALTISSPKGQSHD